MRRAFEAVGRFLRSADMFLFGLCFISAAYGLVLISSAARSLKGGASSFIYVQSVAIALGIALFILFSVIDLEIIADRHWILIVAGLALISTLFFFGVEGDTGNKAWLRFSFGFGIQPAEIAKIPFIIVLGKMFAMHRDIRQMNSVWNMLRVIAVFLAYFALIVISSRDLGSALVYVFILLVMMYMANVYLRWFAMGIALVGAGSPLIWSRFLGERQKNRILVLFDETIDDSRLDLLWQTDRSREAMMLGRFFGSGYGNGKITQSGIIPQQHTDFILSAAGEEFGFFGVIVIFILLLAIISRCIYIGVKSNDKLGLLVSMGIAAMLIAQSLENIGMCLGVTPVVGLTLPFFSYGGSSIITLFAAVGIVSGIKMHTRPVRY